MRVHQVKLSDKLVECRPESFNPIITIGDEVSYLNGVSGRLMERVKVLDARPTFDGKSMYLVMENEDLVFESQIIRNDTVNDALEQQKGEALFNDKS